MLVGWVMALSIVAAASLNLMPWLQTASSWPEPPLPPLFEPCRNDWLHDPARMQLLVAQQRYYAALSDESAVEQACHG